MRIFSKKDKPEADAAPLPEQALSPDELDAVSGGDGAVIGDGTFIVSGPADTSGCDPIAVPGAAVTGDPFVIKGYTAFLPLQTKVPDDNGNKTVVGLVKNAAKGQEAL